MREPELAVLHVWTLSAARLLVGTVSAIGTCWADVTGSRCITGRLV